MTATPVALTPRDIEIATRAADHFTRIYYTTYDSDTRLADLPQFYRPTSSLTWNGKPFQGADGLRQLVERMPITKHEVQSFDCHPIPGTQPPSLLITVSGSVTHGLGPAGNPPNTPSRTIDGHPRVFSQTFMLVPDPDAPPTKPGEVAKYYISADALRRRSCGYIFHNSIFLSIGTPSGNGLITSQQDMRNCDVVRRKTNLVYIGSEF